MATLMCNYSVPGAGRGGELTGPGFGRGNPVTLQNRDVLTVTITWDGNAAQAPAQLTGYFVFTAAPNAPPAQAWPSPFSEDNRYFRCFAPQTANKSTGPGAPTYAFGGFIYFGGRPGQYELTFVAEIGTGTAAPTQWSADPEFETGN